MLRIASFKHNQKPTYGIVLDGGVIDCGARLKEFPDMLAVLRGDAINQLRTLAQVDPDIAAEEIEWLPPIPNPQKIICVGINYKAHIKEMGRDNPEYPWLFVRFPNSIVGHKADLVRPAASDQFDYEGELAVIIGSGGRHIRAENALASVAGYTCFNDGSIRDFQRHSSQFTAGKNFVNTGSCGPWLVVAETDTDPSNFNLTTRLNGNVMQQAPVSDLCFDVPALIQYCSTVTELVAGDILVTGTPGGVGAARTPPVWMCPGDVLEVDIEGVGSLTNRVVSEET
jgi:2-keto-4-pentenoate hydratase/2-oxohepta-3-ene-1,7-dioic acid hydratase in catechol pathway